MIVLWVKMGGKEHPVGLRADRVIEVTRLDEDRLESFAREGLLNWDNRMVEGVGKRNGEFVTVLDLDGMLSSGVISDFHDSVTDKNCEYREAG